MMARHTWAIVLIADMMKLRAPDPTPFRNGPTTLVYSRQLQALWLRHAGGKIHNLAVTPTRSLRDLKKKKERKKGVGMRGPTGWPAAAKGTLVLRKLASGHKGNTSIEEAGQRPQREHINEEGGRRPQMEQ